MGLLVGSRRALLVPSYREQRLTLSGNEITDAVRRAGVEGDGVSPSDFSLGIWEATTNLCTNGGFETNTTGWTTSGTSTIERSTAQAKFGAASAKCTRGTGTSLAIAPSATLTAALHAISV